MLGYVSEDLAGGARTARGGGLPGRREDRQDRDRSSFDRYLRGHAGAAQPRRLARPAQGTFDSAGRPAREHDRLTLDIGLQRVAERALHDRIDLAYEDDRFNANGGAIVALDPRDGAVLAVASNPTYKPSVYVGRVDPKLAPLTVDRVAKQRNYEINRAIRHGVYPLGSTFKPLTALAAISDGLYLAVQYIQCTPYAEYGLDKHRFDNWNPYPNMAMTLTTALSQSYDTYFYDVGNRYYARRGFAPVLDPRMQSWAKKFGFGEQPGLDIAGSAAGLLPTPTWRRATYRGSTGRGTRAT